MPNMLTYNAPPLILNGATVPGGFSINFDMGPTVQQTTEEAYAFLSNNMSNSVGFLGNVIDGTQHSIQMDTTSANQLFSMINSTNQAVMLADAQARQSAAANSGGGGGSYVCTAIFEEGLINDEDYEKLIKFRNGFMKSTRVNRKLLKLYVIKAPSIVFAIKSSNWGKKIFQVLHEKYLSIILRHLRENKNDEALAEYWSMMIEADAVAKTI